MSDNPRRVIYRLGSLDEPSFVRYGNGELALLPPDAPHKFLCRYCLVHNNNVEESVYTGNTYYQRHGAKCNHYGRPADEVLSLQLMRELSLNDGPPATLTTEDNSEKDALNTKDDMAETAALNADLTVKKAFKEKPQTGPMTEKPAPSAAKVEKPAPSAAKVVKNTQTGSSSTDKMVTRSSGRRK